MAPIRNTFLLILGWLSFAVGFIGIFVPLLPTTPFMIVAAACFAKASPRMHGWLLRQKKIGPALRDWEEFGVIRKKAKIMAILLLWLGISFPIVFVKVHIGIKVLLVVIAISVTGFIATRPSQPKE